MSNAHSPPTAIDRSPRGTTPRAGFARAATAIAWFREPLKNSGVLARISRASGRVCERIERRRRERIRAARLLGRVRELSAEAARRPLLWERVGRNRVQLKRKYAPCQADVGTWRMGAVVFGVPALLALLVLAGCAATTDAAGPAASATHEVRDEAPGVTRLKLRVRPGAEGTEAPRQQGTETEPDGAEGCETGPGKAPPRGAGRGGAGEASSARAPHPLFAILAMAAIAQVGEADAAQYSPEIPAILRDAIDAARASGLEVELEYEHAPLSADTTRSTFAESPATLETSSDQAALGFTTKLRRFPLPWGGEARGGGFGFEATLLGGDGVNVLHVVGAGVMALAVIPLLRTPRRWSAAAVFAVCGLAIVMTGTLVDEYPWVTLLAAVALLGLLAYGAYEAWRRGRANVALDRITPVVQEHPYGEQLKDLIGKRAGKMLAAVKAETTASKRRVGV